MEDKVIAGNFQITLPGPNGASMQISGYVFAGEDVNGLNERMDVCREALIRQQEALEVPVLEEKIKALEKQKHDVQAAYADLLEKQKAKTLASAEKPHLANYPRMVKQIDEEIEKGRTKIAAVRKVA